ncbi:MAG: MFS transporter [Planctomycetota bacterium]|nr:MFS transporter [Planctomycetota bacterium]
MTRLARLLALSFIESFATVLVERGVYFYSHERLAFDDAANLWLAFGIGAFYVLGALLSHRLAVRLGERRLLLLLLLGHLASHILLLTVPHLVPFVVVNLLLAGFTGAKWPIIESYINAGLDAKQTSRAVGQFNLSWSLAVPFSMAAVGPLIAWQPSSLFGLPALVNLASLALVLTLEPHPVHLAPDHPERLADSVLVHYRRLLWSNRISLIASYTLLFIVTPLMPTIFEKLGWRVWAPALASLVEIVRTTAFILMFAYTGWHGRRAPALWAAIGLPIGFCLILTGDNLATVLAGEVLFGAAAGVGYYAALYYAMVVTSASVESGGAHESLIGGGFAFGPALGLMGLALGPMLGGPTTGMLVIVAPLAVAALVGSLRLLRTPARAAA